MLMVLVISTANFWKMISCPPKRNAPDPKVVRVPLKMLTPIYLKDCLILSFLER